MSVSSSSTVGEDWRRFEQGSGVWLLWEPANLIAASQLHQLAGAHYCDVGGKVADQRHRVGNEEISQMECLL